MVYPHLRMIGGMECADAAGHWLCQRCFIICASLIFQQTAQFHHFRRNDAIRGVAAEELIGITRAPHRPFIIQGRLQCELHARLEPILVLLSYFDDVSCHLMSHDGRMIRHIFMHALVRGAQDGTFVGGHTNAVGYYFYQDLIILDLGQLEFFQPQVVRSM